MEEIKNLRNKIEIEKQVLNILRSETDKKPRIVVRDYFYEITDIWIWILCDFADAIFE
jgi:hypothetical protein